MKLNQLVIDKGINCDIMTSSHPQNIKILTTQEVADTLRVHRSTIARCAISGELKSYLIGNRRLFKEDDVWAFFENRADRKCVVGKED